VVDYYEILGIDRKASGIDVRAAYKRQAMLYHPDRNAGDKESEEKFKLINEAYHVLSDPLKRYRYDNHVNANQEQVLTEAYWREVKKRKYYEFRRTQQFSYKVDKEYYKVQGLAFLVFVVLSGICFAMIHTVNYYIDQKQAQQWRENNLRLKNVYTLFDDQQYAQAFSMINGLRKAEPLDYRFYFAHDSLLSELRLLANTKYKTKEFEQAVYYYMILSKEENPVRLETLNMIAHCQYYLGQYEQSLTALKQLHNQQPWNLELIYRIALINIEKLDNKKEALHYLSLGKKLFKKNLSEVYGSAFEVVMDPSDVPDVYYSIFIARARTNLSLGNYHEAITDCNWAISLRKNEPDPYSLRASAKIAMNQTVRACEDLHIASNLGLDVRDKQTRYCQ
jgi:tetratricopeptide (TPR) repeat protein